VKGVDDGSSVARRTFYRYMSRAEARAVGEPGDVGFLRGGRPGRTYWTDRRYETARQAKAELALEDLPEVRLAFVLRGDVELDLDGCEVRADNDEPGGGVEWMVKVGPRKGPVEVEVIAVEDLR
jgi:hypothetical protein